MYEIEHIQLHEAIDLIIREMIGGSTMEFRTREVNGVTVTGKLFPYQTIGISGTAARMPGRHSMEAGPPSN